MGTAEHAAEHFGWSGQRGGGVTEQRLCPLRWCACVCIIARDLQQPRGT
jgi:hypothetical protein